MNSLLGIVKRAAAYCPYRRAIRWRTVIGAFSIQLLLACFVLYVPVGREMLFGFAQGVSTVIGYTGAGINFLFGSLASEDFGFVFAIQVLSVIVFFSSLISVLYYLGIMKWVIKFRRRVACLIAVPNHVCRSTFLLARLAQKICAIDSTMTRSELFADGRGHVFCIGSVLAGYAGVGVELKYFARALWLLRRF